MNENKFEFTYTAPTENERRTIESIKNQYVGKTEGSYERLIKLDKKVKNSATIPALITGIIGTLILGLGMTMVLEWQIYVWGIIVGVLGAIPIALGPIVYKLLFRRGKKKYGDEIIALSDELLKK